jgi:hypothetical protein
MDELRSVYVQQSMVATSVFVKSVFVPWTVVSTMAKERTENRLRRFRSRRHRRR